MRTPAILGPDEWQAALEEHRAREESLTRARDELAAARRRLPWTPIDKEYRFDDAGSTVTLCDSSTGPAARHLSVPLRTRCRRLAGCRLCRLFALRRQSGATGIPPCS